MSDDNKVTKAEALMTISEMISLLEHANRRIQFVQDALGDESPPEFRVASARIRNACDNLQEGVIYAEGE